jgi:hypothetical protein
MTDKHTSSPWTLDTLTGTVIGPNVRGYCANVANIYGPDGEAWDAETETRGNAALIVEAPAMLAALRNAFIAYAGVTGVHPGAMNDIRAILARIDGEA